MPPEICSNCGAEVPPGSRVCPACGSDEETGWSEEANAQNLGLPDEDFDYEEFRSREFEESEITPRGIQWVWLLVAVGLVLAFVAIWLF